MNRFSINWWYCLIRGDSCSLNMIGSVVSCKEVIKVILQTFLNLLPVIHENIRFPKLVRCYSQILYAPILWLVPAKVVIVPLLYNRNETTDKKVPFQPTVVFRHITHKTLTFHTGFSYPSYLSLTGFQELYSELRLPIFWNLCSSYPQTAIMQTYKADMLIIASTTFCGHERIKTKKAEMRESLLILKRQTFVHFVCKAFKVVWCIPGEVV